MREVVNQNQNEHPNKFRCEEMLSYLFLIAFFVGFFSLIYALHLTINIRDKIISFEQENYHNDTEKIEKVNWCEILIKPSGKIDRIYEQLNSHIPKTDLDRILKGETNLGHCCVKGNNLVNMHGHNPICIEKKESEDFYVIEDNLYWKDEIMHLCCLQSGNPFCYNYLVQIPEFCRK